MWSVYVIKLNLDIYNLIISIVIVLYHKLMQKYKLISQLLIQNMELLFLKKKKKFRIKATLND